MAAGSSSVSGGGLFSDDSSTSDSDFIYFSEAEDSEEYSTDSSEEPVDSYHGVVFDSSDDETLARKRPRLDVTIRPSAAAERATAAAALKDRWKDDGFNPSTFPFTIEDQDCGVNNNLGLSNLSTEFDVFKQVFSGDIMTQLVTETNIYGDVLLSKEDIKRKSRLHAWSPTDAKEMWVFLATFMLMALQKKNKLADYWSTDNLLATPVFGKIISSNRFLIILRALHFSNNENQVPGDKLYKVRPILEMMKASFAVSFYPFQNLVIDESLMLWKGRLAFKQFIPSKRHRFGLKLFILCDCKTGFIIDFIVYTGAATEIKDVEGDMGVSGAIVMTLMDRFLQKGHVLYTDNWYSSPALFEKLHGEQTGTCGTVKHTRKGMPVFPKKMNKGDLVEKHTDILLASKWHDRRDVHMLSTVDTPGLCPSGKKDRATGNDVMKPGCVLHYNKNMGSIDQSDMQLSFVECIRKTVKWYKKFFFHLLDMSTYNAYVMFKELHGDAKLEFSKFRLELIRQILTENHLSRPSPKGGRHLKAQNPLRLTERHFPEIVPSTEKKKNASRKCYVCANTTLGPVKRRETRYMCAECNVGLCVTPCFGLYHTKLHF